MGEVVLAKFHEDKKWYRSEVTDIKGDNYKIMFIDYGNEESVNSGDIRQIQDASLLRFPRFAVSFGIQGFEEMNLSQKILNVSIRNLYEKMNTNRKLHFLPCTSKGSQK